MIFPLAVNARRTLYIVFVSLYGDASAAIGIRIPGTAVLNRAGFAGGSNS